MATVIIPGGWKKEIFDVAEKVIVRCICKKEIDLKVGGMFSAVKQPQFKEERITFLCNDCFSKVVKALKCLDELEAGGEK